MPHIQNGLKAYQKVHYIIISVALYNVILIEYSFLSRLHTHNMLSAGLFAVYYVEVAGSRNRSQIQWALSAPDSLHAITGILLAKSERLAKIFKSDKIKKVSVCV